MRKVNGQKNVFLTIHFSITGHIIKFRHIPLTLSLLAGYYKFLVLWEQVR